MKYLITFCLGIILLSTAYGQCPKGSTPHSSINLYDATNLVTGVRTQLVGTMSLGRYFIISDIIPGETYRIDACEQQDGSGTNYANATHNTFMTIFEGGTTNVLGYNDDFCGDDASIDLTIPAGVTGIDVQLNHNGCSSAGFTNSALHITLMAPPCVNPDVPNVTTNTPTICTGGSATLDWSGANLNDATTWQVYTNSCGGTLLTSTTSTSITVNPTTTTTYYIRGEDGAGCVDESTGLCGSITITVNPLDDASFSYSAAAYCVDDTDPTPTITGLGGGSFSSTAGLSISASTGEIDLSSSTPGTYTVTYTTTGTCPNSTSKSITINELDDASFSYGASTYCPGASNPLPTTTGLAGGTFSSTAGLSINPTSGEIDLGASTNGTYTVTYTTNGPCPNHSDVVITIEDVVAPSITCSGDIFDYLDQSCEFILPDLTSLATATDNCTANPIITQSPAIGSVITETTTITLTADDGNGNTNDCTFDMILSDGTAPTAICQNITISLNAAGNASITANDIDNGSNDNCGAVTLSASQTAFTCADIGANNVTLTVTDGNGNSYDCVAVVTVVDNINPSITCSGNQTENPDANCEFILPDYTSLATATDNCTANPTITQWPAAGTLISGTTTITLTANDGNGNTDDCTFDVILSDGTPPTVVCQNIGVFLDATGNATIVDTDIDGGSTDNCSGLTFAVSQTAFTCADLGVNNVTLTATDANGNSDNCVAEVTVIDSVTPTAVCQNITVYLDAMGNANITTADIDGGSTDNCGAVTLSASQTAFTCADLGTNNVTLTVTDASGNTSDCMAMVTVIDDIHPSITCSGNQTENPDANCEFTLPDYTSLATAMDNCTANPTITQMPVAGTLISGTTTITLTADDGNGNTDDCTFDVVLSDGTAPTAVCQNITISLDAMGNASIVAADIDNGSNDNCGAITLTASQTTFTCADLGANNVTLTVTDANGNTDDCVAVVTVMDDMAPTTVCQNFTVYLDATGNASITTTDIDGGTTDNCGTVTLSTSQTAFTCADLGANNVTLTATDASGNSSDCIAVVTVMDDIAPSITCPGDQSTCSTTVPDYTGMATTTDNCDATPVITQSPAAGSATMVGNMTIVLTSTDAEGNADNCSFTLTVNPEYNETVVVSICDGDSYPFGMQALTTAGTYTEVFSSVDGCDSTVVLTLIENPVYNEMATASICNGDSYTFGTQILTTGGTYTEVFTTVDGCDSTVTLTLTEFPSYNEIAMATICSGDSYTFGTQTLTAGGTYTEVFTTVNGCDSTVVLTLTEFPPYNETTTATICSGNSYTFGTQTLTTGGTYTEVFTSINGCDSTVVLTLIENPVYNEVASASFCAGDNYTFGTQTLTVAGTYTEVFSSVGGCDSTVVLTLTENPVYNETATADFCAGYSYTFGTQTLTAAGTYTEVFTSVDGCDSTVVLTLSEVTAYNETVSDSFCTGETYTFGTQTLTTAGTYTEQFVSTVGCDSTVVLTLTENPVYYETAAVTSCDNIPYVFGSQTLTTSGTYTEVFTSTGGCDSTVILTLTVEPAFNTTETATICSGNSYVFGTQTLTTGGTYTEVFTAINGCDSTVVLTLTEFPSYNETITASICSGDSYTFGSQILTMGGIYTEVYTTINGCDSTVVLTLIENPVYNEMVSATFCAGDTYTFGTQSLTVAGTYTEVFTSINGCDSTVVLTLTENPVYNETAAVTTCSNVPYVFGSQSLTTSGTYTEVFTSTGGCDSTVVLTLTVEPAFNTTETATICSGDNYTFGTQTLTTSGTYTEVFTAINGCDSTVTLTLTENPVYNETATVTICNGDSYMFGTQTLTMSGTYTELFTSVDGCDSTVNLTLIVGAENLDVTQVGAELTADNANGTYQWVDCDNGYAPITGETNQMYTATNNGNYAVIITEAGCTDTSACYNVTGVSIISNEFGKHITMYPNPANELVTVELGDDIQDINIQMYDVSGQLVYTQSNISDHKTTIDISQFERGIYLIEFSYGDNNKVIRLTVQ